MTAGGQEEQGRFIEYVAVVGPEPAALEQAVSNASAPAEPQAAGPEGANSQSSKSVATRLRALLGGHAGAASAVQASASLAAAARKAAIKVEAGAVLERFPTNDREEVPFKYMAGVLPTFCFLGGLQVERERPLEASPVHFMFALTTPKGGRAYVSCVLLHERTKVKDAVFFVPKAICIVSRIPCHNLFRQLLGDILAAAGDRAGTALVRRLVAQLVLEVPLPPDHSAQVLFSAGGRTASLRDPTFLRDFSFRPLLACLSAPRLLELLLMLVTERKVVLVTKRSVGLLSAVCEVALAVLFPFQWEHLYLPVLPVEMLWTLECPAPFFAGVQGDLDQTMVPEDVTVFNLDQEAAQPQKIADLPGAPRCMKDGLFKLRWVYEWEKKNQAYWDAYHLVRMHELIIENRGRKRRAAFSSDKNFGPDSSLMTFNTMTTVDDGASEATSVLGDAYASLQPVHEGQQEAAPDLAIVSGPGSDGEEDDASPASAGGSMGYAQLHEVEVRRSSRGLSATTGGESSEESPDTSPGSRRATSESGGKAQQQQQQLQTSARLVATPCKAAVAAPPSTSWVLAADRPESPPHEELPSPSSLLPEEQGGDGAAESGAEENSTENRQAQQAQAAVAVAAEGCESLRSQGTFVRRRHVRIASVTSVESVLSAASAESLQSDVEMDWDFGPSQTDGVVASGPVWSEEEERSFRVKVSATFLDIFVRMFHRYGKFGQHAAAAGDNPHASSGFDRSGFLEALGKEDKSCVDATSAILQTNAWDRFLLLPNEHPRVHLFSQAIRLYKQWMSIPVADRGEFQDHLRAWVARLYQPEHTVVAPAPGGRRPQLSRRQRSRYAVVPKLELERVGQGIASIPTSLSLAGWTAGEDWMRPGFNAVALFSAAMVPALAEVEKEEASETSPVSGAGTTPALLVRMLQMILDNRAGMLGEELAGAVQEEVSEASGKLFSSADLMEAELELGGGAAEQDLRLMCMLNGVAAAPDACPACRFAVSFWQLLRAMVLGDEQGENGDCSVVCSNCREAMPSQLILSKLSGAASMVKLGLLDACLRQMHSDDVSAVPPAALREKFPRVYWCLYIFFNLRVVLYSRTPPSSTDGLPSELPSSAARAAPWRYLGTASFEAVCQAYVDGKEAASLAAARAREEEAERLRLQAQALEQEALAARAAAETARLAALAAAAGSGRASMPSGLADDTSSPREVEKELQLGQQQQSPTSQALSAAGGQAAEAEVATPDARSPKTSPRTASAAEKNGSARRSGPLSRSPSPARQRQLMWRRQNLELPLADAGESTSALSATSSPACSPRAALRSRLRQRQGSSSLERTTAMRSTNASQRRHTATGRPGAASAELDVSPTSDAETVEVHREASSGRRRPEPLHFSGCSEESQRSLMFEIFEPLAQESPTKFDWYSSLQSTTQGEEARYFDHVAINLPGEGYGAAFKRKLEGQRRLMPPPPVLNVSAKCAPRAGSETGRRSAAGARQDAISAEAPSVCNLAAAPAGTRAQGYAEMALASARQQGAGGSYGLAFLQQRQQQQQRVRQMSLDARRKESSAYCRYDHDGMGRRIPGGPRSRSLAVAYSRGSPWQQRASSSGKPSMYSGVGTKPPRLLDEMQVSEAASEETSSTSPAERVVLLDRPPLNSRCRWKPEGAAGGQDERALLGMKAAAMVYGRVSKTAGDRRNRRHMH
eukprot:TRINITY_DN20311_c0_g1_i2.p1 TRINITY_DN20311_c0_g1~~TRINITY_DN20311_c0_g1_i2.p1  ORF type:complete len:1685 (-),score=452.65 TRINITY_DN20311_c0_g1_i2:73-5127(-)